MREKEGGRENVWLRYKKKQEKGRKNKAGTKLRWVWFHYQLSEDMSKLCGRRDAWGELIKQLPYRQHQRQRPDQTWSGGIPPRENLIWENGPHVWYWAGKWWNVCVCVFVCGAVKSSFRLSAPILYKWRRVFQTNK